MSKFPVGSSARIILGRWIKARAIARRCFSPPDISLGKFRCLSLRPTIANTWVVSSLISSSCTPDTSSAKATFSKAVLLSNNLKSWKIVPILRRKKGISRLATSAKSMPSMITWPELGTSSLINILIKVDLPAPAAPTSETNSPSLISKLTSSSAVKSSLYFFVTFLNVITQTVYSW